MDYNYSAYSLNESVEEDDIDSVFKTVAVPIFPIQWAAAVISAIVFVLGVPGNALVVWLVVFEMKGSVNTVWFFNLAIADLLCCLSMPFTIMGIILRGHWPLSLFACKLIPSLILVNMYASVLLLTSISIDRCIVVLKPLWTLDKRTVRKAYVACLVVWLLAFVLTSPSFIFRETYTKRDKTVICSMNYILAGEHHQKVNSFIAIFRFVVGFICPLVVIIICYSALLLKVNKRTVKSSKTTRVVLVVIIGFFVCWFPYHVSGLILALHPNTSDLYKSTLKVDPALISIAFINSCINPIIYVLVGQNFKDKFKKSIKSILKSFLEDEQSQSFDTKGRKSSSERFI
ncbi:C5a anaphylatoxin chemotactic receptor 1-like [Rhinophrynus dorsalis]